MFRIIFLFDHCFHKNIKFRTLIIDLTSLRILWFVFVLLFLLFLIIFVVLALALLHLESFTRSYYYKVINLLFFRLVIQFKEVILLSLFLFIYFFWGILIINTTSFCITLLRFLLHRVKIWLKTNTWSRLRCLNLWSYLKSCWDNLIFLDIICWYRKSTIIFFLLLIVWLFFFIIIYRDLINFKIFHFFLNLLFIKENLRAYFIYRLYLQYTFCWFYYFLLNFNFSRLFLKQFI
jgi:hypothetical protein